MNGKNASSETSAVSEHGLTLYQVVAMAVVGVVFWFAAAMTVQFGAPLGIFGPVASAALFVVSFPVAWLGVLIAIPVAGLRPGQYVNGVVVGTCSATICDGIALTWFRGLYGSDPELVLLGAAWILWGISAFFAAAMFEAWRRGVRPV